MCRVSRWERETVLLGFLSPDCRVQSLVRSNSNITAVTKGLPGEKTAFRKNLGIPTVPAYYLRRLLTTSGSSFFGPLAGMEHLFFLLRRFSLRDLSLPELVENLFS